MNSAIDIATRPLHPLFGEEILAIDPADPESRAPIEQVIDRAGMILLRGVQFEDHDLADFATRFGPLESLSADPKEYKAVGHITNMDADGRLFPAGHDSLLHATANELWHIDSTYRPVGARYSFLLARTVTADRGQTDFVDGRATWDALTDARRDELRNLSAGHSIIHSRMLIGFDMGDEARSRLPPIARKLVRPHEPSGRDALLLASHIQDVGDLDYAAGRRLIDDLMTVATAPERVYRHQWQVGDLLMWDNRCMMHRGVPYPYHAQARDMRSCRTIDQNDSGLWGIQ